MSQSVSITIGEIKKNNVINQRKIWKSLVFLSGQSPYPKNVLLSDLTISQKNKTNLALMLYACYTYTCGVSKQVFCFKLNCWCILYNLCFQTNRTCQKNKWRWLPWMTLAEQHMPSTSKGWNMDTTTHSWWVIGYWSSNRNCGYNKKRVF